MDRHLGALNFVLDSSGSIGLGGGGAMEFHVSPSCTGLIHIVLLHGPNKSPITVGFTARCRAKTFSTSLRGAL